MGFLLQQWSNKTAAKLRGIEPISVNEELKHKKQKIADLKKDLENWNKDIEEDIKREKRNTKKRTRKKKQELLKT